MNRKRSLPLILMSAIVMLLVYNCQKDERKVRVEMPELADGTELTVIAYDDSTVLAKGKVNSGIAEITVPGNEDVLTMIMAGDKRVGYYVAERGEAFLKTNNSSAMGTPLNEEFTRLMQQIDSLDQYDEDALFLPFMLEKYNTNKENPVGYFAINYWMRLAEADAIDSVLQTAPKSVTQSKRKDKSVAAAKLRKQTAPGSKYVDFEAIQPDGKTVKLSEMIPAGKYVLLDFWASWCPYCIKEIPNLKSLAEKYPNLQIIGVAVRDEESDTKAMVEEKGISWPVMYNAGRTPYNIYGIGGIPNHILLSPEGVILSLGESVEKLDERLATLK